MIKTITEIRPSCRFIFEGIERLDNELKIGNIYFIRNTVVLLERISEENIYRFKRLYKFNELLVDTDPMIIPLYDMPKVQSLNISVYTDRITKICDYNNDIKTIIKFHSKQIRRFTTLVTYKGTKFSYKLYERYTTKSVKI